ncbi:MAG: hypothetical protein JRI23_05555 [Deltaproteobacteria bacterium]|jgi:hypothetical protein|nr:hypothetical protein [Deltaproteobacteria bacterium]MBW2531019.1 hypothetical protein [Deltaproteobacteria bacterium]
MRRWWAALCALAVGGCAEPSSREFAITLTDALTMQCTGIAVGLLADPEELDDYAEQMRKAYKKAMQTDPPIPRGRLLRVNELESRIYAWFEPNADSPATTTLPPPYDAEPEEVLPTDPDVPELVTYDAPSSVYEGPPNDEYLEAHFAQVFNTDEEDEEASLRLCGPRHRARGTLTLTTTGGIAGRIRWTEIEYVPSELSRCEGRVECARDVAVEGLEVE